MLAAPPGQRRTAAFNRYRCTTMLPPRTRNIDSEPTARPQFRCKPPAVWIRLSCASDESALVNVAVDVAKRGPRHVAARAGRACGNFETSIFNGATLPVRWSDPRRLICIKDICGRRCLLT